MSKLRRLKQILILFAIGLMLGIVATSVWFYHTLNKSLPIESGRIELMGLSQPVEITTDSMGISQVWAQTEDDAYFAIGWLHAEHRFFQMDLVRRLSQGRLSEMLGRAATVHDSTQLIFGHSRMAREALPRLSDKNRALLQSYCDGINAWIRHSDSRPFELVILGLDADEWTVYDCLTVLSFQLWFSDALQNRDEVLFKLARTNGRAKVATLTGKYPDWAPTTVPEPARLGETEPAPNRESNGGRPVLGGDMSVRQGWLDRLNLRNRLRSAIAAALLDRFSSGLSMAHSSNAWAAAPPKSRSGAAVFANDPHLDITRLPQFWYVVATHIAEDSANAVGITAPGLPFISMGHNDRAAWGFTAGGVDITEIYEEHLNPEDSSQYLTPEGWKDIGIIDELITKGDSSRTLQIRTTRNGPIVYSSDTDHVVYSLKWAGFDSDLADVVDAAASLPHVENFEQFRGIVTRFGSLDANWVYADSVTIGYQLGTPIPVRPVETDNLPVPGYTDDYQWQGYRPLDETPHIMNPAQEYVASNNNAPSRDVPGNFAADRILSSTFLLREGDSIDVDYMCRMQMERTDRYLLRWKDEMASVLESIDQPVWADSMRAWDGFAGMESRPTLLANLFLSQLIRFTFDDEIGDDTLTMRFIWMDHVYHSYDTLWFDDITTDDVVETREMIARKAMDSAVALAGDRTWGDALTLTVRHPMAAVPLISNLLDLSHGPYHIGGTAGTLNASFFREQPGGEFSVFVGPSWRMIIDFADPEGTEICLPAGNSGHPMSPHFFDFFERWRVGEYWPMPLERTAVLARSEATLTLTPPAGE